MSILKLSTFNNSTFRANLPLGEPPSRSLLYQRWVLVGGWWSVVRPRVTLPAFACGVTPYHIQTRLRTDPHDTRLYASRYHYYRSCQLVNMILSIAQMLKRKRLSQWLQKHQASTQMKPCQQALTTWNTKYFFITISI